METARSQDTVTDIALNASADPAVDPGTLLQSLDALMRCRASRKFAEVFNHELARYLAFDVAGLYLYSACSEAFTCISEEHLNPGAPGYEISQLPAEGSMKQAVALEQRTLLCSNLIDSLWSEGRALRKWHRASACIIVPLIIPSGTKEAAARTLGVFFVGVHQNGGLGESDCVLLETLGRHFAPALQAVLDIEERDAFMAIDERAAVGKVALNNLLHNIKDIVQGVLPNDGSALIRIENTGGTVLEPISVEGFKDASALRRLPFTDSVFAEAIAQGRPVLLTGHNYCETSEMPYLEALGILSGLLCPIEVEGNAFGFFLIGNRRRNAFSGRDVRLCEYLAHHLSQVIGNLSAFAEIQNLKDQIERENRYLREEVKGPAPHRKMLGTSPAFLKTRNIIEQVAPTDSTVLITGETGTGKELVAQCLFEASRRRDKPFIRVNCATLPENLIESELFGHEKGAFTSAGAKKIGRFELAHEGTLFLDEVGDLPIGLQAKLLRAIESQEFERLGGEKTLKVDVRILSATNVDLEEAVQAGRFRADLYYRLKVLPIAVPPLRARREDIPLLAEHFLRRHAARHRKSLGRIHPSTLKALIAYDWPGNIRELNHMIERAVILSQGPELAIEEFEHKRTDPRPAEAPIKEESPDQLNAVERDHILKVLDQCNWVVAGPKGAAKRLGLHRATLQYRMKKLGIKKTVS